VVASGLERRGIATQLMDAAEAWAARRGPAFLTLETGAANQPARAFYAQRGYRDEDVRLTKAVTPADNAH
jgi:GNAT superfamily N-acetyltransferase